MARWAVGYTVSEGVLDILSLNSISYVRIPAGTCLKSLLSIPFIVEWSFPTGMPSRMVWERGKRLRCVLLLLRRFDTMVQMATAKSIEINTPPMVVYSDKETTIHYLLYLNHADIIHSMCESPFDVTSASS